MEPADGVAPRRLAQRQDGNVEVFVGRVAINPAMRINWSVCNPNSFRYSPSIYLSRVPGRDRSRREPEYA
jgi:hypothetical protein